MQIAMGVLLMEDTGLIQEPSVGIDRVGKCGDGGDVGDVKDMSGSRGLMMVEIIDIVNDEKRWVPPAPKKKWIRHYLLGKDRLPELSSSTRCHW